MLVWMNIRNNKRIRLELISICIEIEFDGN